MLCRSAPRAIDNIPIKHFDKNWNYTQLRCFPCLLGPNPIGYTDSHERFNCWIRANSIIRPLSAQKVLQLHKKRFTATRRSALFLDFLHSATEDISRETRALHLSAVKLYTVNQRLMIARPLDVLSGRVHVTDRRLAYSRSCAQNFRLLSSLRRRSFPRKSTKARVNPLDRARNIPPVRARDGFLTLRRVR